MARAAPLRTLVLGDLHGSLLAFRAILIRAGLLEGDSWRGGRTLLVQLGDVLDRGPDSIETYDFLADLQVRAGKGRGSVVRLLGNHEISLLEGDYDMADFPEPERMAERIRIDVREGKVQAAFGHRGWLFTHAGLHLDLLQKLRAEMVVAQGRPRRFTLPRLAAELNHRLVRAVETGDYSDPIFAVGESRGGEEASGGIFWADFDHELASPTRAPLFHQVFGHTPEGYEGARFRVTSDRRRINIDIGIVEEHGGNLGYLEIRGREAHAHYLEEDGETVEFLGKAPLARGKRSSPQREPQTA